MAYGLRILSECHIPGALPYKPAKSELTDPDITIKFDEIPRNIEFSRELWPYSWRPGMLLFDMPEVARYLCSANGSMKIDSNGPIMYERIAEMLIATALPVMLWMRGDIVIHAACVQLPGAEKLIAFSGPSGIGKSAILMHCVRMGGKVIGDDTIRFVYKSKDVKVSGLPSVVFCSDPLSDERIRFDVPAPQVMAIGELGAVIVLKRCPPGIRPGFSELRGKEAIMALLAQRHRPRALKVIGAEPEILKIFGDVLTKEKIKIYTWFKREGDDRISQEELDFLHAAG